MKKFTLIFVFFLSISMDAQPPLRFYSKFGGSGDDIGYSGKSTLDKQYIVTGSTSSYGNGNTDVYLVKVDSMGSPIWEKFIGGFGNEVGKSVIQLPDSGYMVAGFTNSFGEGGYDAYLIRTDKTGNLIWQRTFGGMDWDFASDLVQASDGNVFVVGNTVSFGNGKKDGFVLKYDISGNLIWKKFIGGLENDELNSIIKTNDNNLATVGYTESGKDIDGDAYFLKLDLNGDTLFTRTFGGPYKDWANDVVHKTNNDNYFICGASTFSLNSKTKSYIHLISSTGVFQMEQLYYNSTGDEQFISLSNSQHLSHLTGFLRDVPVPIVQMQGNLIIAHQDGNAYKVNSFGGYQDETFYSIEGTKDGGYLCLGSTFSFNSLGKDVFLIKLDSIMVNYDNLTDIKEDENLNPVAIKYLGNSKVEFCFLQRAVPETLKLYDLYGKIIEEFKVLDGSLIVDLSFLADPLLIVKVTFNDGNVYHSKIINR